jgi:hypothetical protein
MNRGQARWQVPPEEPDPAEERHEQDKFCGAPAPGRRRLREERADGGSGDGDGDCLGYLALSLRA